MIKKRNNNIHFPQKPRRTSGAFFYPDGGYIGYGALEKVSKVRDVVTKTLETEKGTIKRNTEKEERITAAQEAIAGKLLFKPKNGEKFIKVPPLGLAA